MHPTHSYNGQSSNKRRSTTDSEADDMRQHTSTAITKKNTNAHAWGHSEICLMGAWQSHMWCEPQQWRSITVGCQELQHNSMGVRTKHTCFTANKLKMAKGSRAIAILMQTEEAHFVFVFVFAFVFATSLVFVLTLCWPCPCP